MRNGLEFNVLLVHFGKQRLRHVQGLVVIKRGL